MPDRADLTRCGTRLPYWEDLDTAEQTRVHEGHRVLKIGDTPGFVHIRRADGWLVKFSVATRQEVTRELEVLVGEPRPHPRSARRSVREARAPGRTGWAV